MAFYGEGFDATPIGGELEPRATALLAFIEGKAGKGAQGAIHPTEALILSAKYGIDAVQKLIDDAVITGI